MNVVVKSPYDQHVVAEVEPDSASAVDAKLDRARAAFRAWREVPIESRIEQVQRAVAVFRQQHEDTAREVSEQMGKPVAEARSEVDTMLDRAEYTLTIAKAALAAQILPEKPGFVRRIEHVPLGVVFNVAAWNYPLLLPINVIVPALLAGNAVLLKHSDKTALSGIRFARVFAELDVADAVQNLVVSHEQVAAVVGDARIDHLAFTGSVKGGRTLYQSAAATRFIDVGLELGGKDPAYVAADADLAFAVAGIVDGACYNAGQSCCAVERVYVHRSRYEEFIDRARATVAAYVLGDPMVAATTMGPLVGTGQPGFLAAQVQDAVTRGARLIAGGAAPEDIDHGQHFFCPTLLADVPNDADVMQEESFGPLVPVAAVDSDEEALARMDDTRFGLTASVWTADQERAERLARDLDVGTVFQNRCDYLDPALPWTGVRDSGKGSTLAPAGFFHLTRRKSIHFRIQT